MNWSRLSNRLLAIHSLRPQNAKRVELALAEIKRGVDQLTVLGHQFHLAPGPEPEEPKPDWPRVYWTVDGRSRKVSHPTDLVVLGDGWFPTLAEAQQKAGMAHQFKGRGGVNVGGLPAVIIEGARK